MPYHLPVADGQQRRDLSVQPEALLEGSDIGPDRPRPGRPHCGPVARHQDLVDVERKVCQPGDWRIPKAEAQHGHCLACQGRFAEAEQLLLSACTKYGGIQAPADKVDRARRWLVELYETWDAAVPGQGIAQRADAWRTPPTPGR